MADKKLGSNVSIYKEFGNIFGPFPCWVDQRTVGLSVWRCSMCKPAHINGLNTDHVLV